MVLCLDIGNTQMNCGVFDGDEFILNFRRTSKDRASSDEIGIFLKSVLNENKIDSNQINSISMCSVVPESVHSIVSACIKYFDYSPFILKAGVKTGLRIKYRNPLEVGTDRIANAIAGVHRFPGKDLIIIDFGTATTFCVISKEKDYLGGIILPGLKISMEALEQNASKLQSVEIKPVTEVVGKSTAESIQSGLYFGQIGTVKEIVKRITKEAFNGETPYVIGTGGFSSLFSDAGIFNDIMPHLVLEGLKEALKLNTDN